MGLTLVRGYVGTTAPEIHKDSSHQPPPGHAGSDPATVAHQSSNQVSNEAVINSVRILTRPAPFERKRVSSSDEATSVAEKLAKEIKEENSDETSGFSPARVAHGTLTASSARHTF